MHVRNRELDLKELVSRALAFRSELAKVKANHRSAAFEWYPYDSFSVFPILLKLLKEERRDLLKIAGAASILDLGCGDGDLSFFFESLGLPVLAIDNRAPNYNGTLGFHWLRTALGSSVEFQLCDLDLGLNLRNRTFGLALSLGILYHLKNPFGFLESLARSARYCLLSTRIAQVTPSGTNIANDALAYFLDCFEANQDASNYWIFSETALKRIIQRTGWDLCDYLSTGFMRGSTPTQDDRDQRAFCMLRSRLSDPWLGVDLDGGWHSMEQGSWRWTERVFRVRLARNVPHPRTLRFKFRIPEPIFKATGPIRLQATVGGDQLPVCAYDRPGDHLYEHNIREPAPSGSVIPVRFELDKAHQPTQEDFRELGVQVVFWSYRESPARAMSPIVLE